MNTPENVTALGENEILTFGSNCDGLHAGGAARVAYERFGAVWGQGEGLQGDCYAIPTMEGFEALSAAVGRFLDYATAHPGLTFLVTKVGTGIAGYDVADVAPLFVGHSPNVVLPSEFEVVS